MNNGITSDESNAIGTFIEAMKNKQFEEWFNNHDNLGEIEIQNNFYPFGIKDFKELPFSMQWGVYLEFFDSKQIVIEIRIDVLEACEVVTGFNIQYGNLVHMSELSYNTRAEAQQEAIKKAFSILEQ